MVRSTVARWCAALALAVLFAPLGLLVGAAAHAEPADAAVSRFASCVAGQKSGQVLFLIDESLSLQKSDPKAARVAAAKELARQLQLASDRDAAQLDVSIAAFSDSYRVITDWTALGNDSMGAVTDGLAKLETSNTGRDTDYATALTSAAASLAAKRKPNAAPGCQMIVWFTDGALDFDYQNRGQVDKEFAPGQQLNSPADRDAMKKAAESSICRPGGVADQLRSSGVITVAIGLDAQSRAADFNLLQAIATGAAPGGRTCGTVTEPVPGAFYRVTDMDGLLRAFALIGGGAGIETKRGACARNRVCEDAKHRFVLDKSVSSVSIFADATTPGLTPVIVAPDGSEHRLDAGKPGKIDVGGAAITYSSPSDKSVSIEMSSTDAAKWRGVWALVFVSPEASVSAQTQSNIRIYGDLAPAWPGNGNTKLRSGDKAAPFFFVVTNKKGQTVAVEDLPGTVSFSAELVTRAGRTIPVAADVPKNKLTQKRTADLAGVAPGAATLHMTLAVTTAPARDAKGKLVAGTPLVPKGVDLPVTINPPAGYPQVPARVDFGTVTGAGEASAPLPVDGSGCVWVAPQGATKVQAAPSGADGLTVTSTATSRENCVKSAGDGTTTSLPLTLHVPNQARGTASGTVTVMVAKADGAGQPQAMDVQFSAILAKKQDTANTILGVLAALLLGPLVPLGLAYLAKWWTARIPARSLRAEAIAVTVSGSSILRAGEPFAFRDNDFVRMVPGTARPSRHLDLGPGGVLDTRVGRSPFGTGFVVASAPGMVGAAGKTGDTFGPAPDAKLPLNVHNRWFVLHNPSGSPDQATVVVLVGDDAGRATVERFAEEITESLGAVLATLRQQAGAAAATSDPADPFGGAGGYGGRADPFSAGPPAPGPGSFGPPRHTGPAPRGPAPSSPGHGGPPPGGPAAGGPAPGWAGPPPRDYNPFQN
ncbi:VWA domain-containing protein [Gordonia defluvii]|uniref:VWA domain-containing protein n=1 Tax=Gordonia defluvii TaxID=283718 RepID=A0ABP6L8H6_9ACTN|nr:VWA domain-containing protein [Gordonia sp. UBA5067]